MDKDIRGFIDLSKIRSDVENNREIVDVESLNTLEKIINITQDLIRRGENAINGIDSFPYIVEQYKNEVNEIIAIMQEQIDSFDTSIPEKVDQFKAEFNQKIKELKEAFEEIDANINALDLGLEQEGDYLYPTFKNQRGIPVKIEGGIGGGGGTTSSLVLTNTSGWNNRTFTNDSKVELKFRWRSTIDETVEGQAEVKINGKSYFYGVTQNKEEVIDISSLLSSVNTVEVTVTDALNGSASYTVRVSIVNLTLTCNLIGSSRFNKDNSAEVSYRLTSAINHKFHIIIADSWKDLETSDNEIVTDDTYENENIVNIGKFSHGAHYAKAYVTTRIDGREVASNIVYLSFISYDATSNVPIFLIKTREFTVEERENVILDYEVFSPIEHSFDVNIKFDGNTSVVSNSTTSYSFIPTKKGVATVILSATNRNGDEFSEVVTYNVVASTINVSAVTNKLEFYLSAEGRSNGELGNRDTWKDKIQGVECIMSGFNFVSDGWITENGYTSLRLAGGSSLVIPYKMFKNNFTDGKTIEIEFKTSEVLDYDVPIISCSSGGRGIVITPQSFTLTSALNSVKGQYKEDEHVRITIVVEDSRVGSIDANGNSIMIPNSKRLMLVYIDGIMSGAVKLSNSDDFSQNNPLDIVVNSNYCNVDLYNIRVYGSALNRRQILNNWIADTQNMSERRDRYRRNDVYDSEGKISIDKLPFNLPYMIFEPYDKDKPGLPIVKGDKRNINMIYVDREHPELSFVAMKTSLNVQGTSSQTYYKKNFKGKSKGGDGYPAYLVNGVSQSKYALNGEKYNTPVAVYTFKADVASSEGANNVELVKLYNDFEPYEVPPKEGKTPEEKRKIRSGIDGYPIVLFYRDENNKVTFYGKMNFNHDKETNETYGLTDGDELWSTESNTSLIANFLSADGTPRQWAEAFERVYPETEITNDSTDDEVEEIVAREFPKLKELVTWISSTYRKDTDSDEVKAEKLQKFKDEIEDHINLQSALYFYCFVEMFLMSDSRTKNMFPKYFAEVDRWYFHAYDMDTALGINNEGKLEFPYYLEEGIYNQKEIYNGWQNVLWNNLRDAFPNEITQMYRSMTAENKLTYNVIEKRFEDHQNKWCEAIFNEDMYVKCIEPYVVDYTYDMNGNVTESDIFIPMLQGRKEQQRKWWLSNRLKFLGSKHLDNVTMNDFISMKAAGNQDHFEITPYAEIYSNIKVDSSTVKKRARRNEETIVENPVAEAKNGAVIIIYSASQLKDIGDISGFKPMLIDISSAHRLQRLKVGGEEQNGQLSTVTVGSNKLIKEIDLTNCIGLGRQSDINDDGESVGTPNPTLDLSGCTNIEKVYCGGTSLAEIKFPNGGILDTVIYPDTLKFLTILNQNKITTIDIPNISAIERVRIEGDEYLASNLNDLAREIVDSEDSNLEALRLVGIDWEFNSNEEMLQMVDKLCSLRGLNNENEASLEHAYIVGTFRVEFAYTKIINEIKSKFNDIGLGEIEVMYEHLDEVNVTYVVNGESTRYISKLGETCEFDGEIPTIEGKEFIGWVDEDKKYQEAINLEKDLTLYAEYVDEDSKVAVSSNLWYYINDDEMVFFGNNAKLPSYWVRNHGVPSYTKIRVQKGVTEIQGNWMSGNNIVESIVLHSNVKAIGAYAFLDCTSLRTFFMRDTVRSILNGCFENCNSLEEINLPENSSFINILGSTFKGCTNLKYIRIPEYIVTIGASAFEGCISLGSEENIIIPESVHTMFQRCFAESGLRGISIPFSLDRVVTEAFRKCNSLKSVTFADNLSFIEDYAFEESGLEEVNIPENVVYIKSYAFDNCADLTRVNVSSTDLSIGYSSFGINKLDEIHRDYYFSGAYETGDTISIKLESSAFYGFASSKNNGGKIFFNTQSIADNAKNDDVWKNYQSYIHSLNEN